jgi:uncharacterized protein (TIGR02444 family)
MNHLELENAFWRYSLHVYDAKGVAEECLAIQEKLGLDVNVLLFCVWIGMKGITLSEAQLVEINTVVQNWNAMVVKPMRAVGRTLKDKRLPEEAVMATAFTASLHFSFGTPMTATCAMAERVHQIFTSAMNKFPARIKVRIARLIEAHRMATR